MGVILFARSIRMSTHTMADGSSVVLLTFKLYGCPRRVSRANSYDTLDRDHRSLSEESWNWTKKRRLGVAEVLTWGFRRLYHLIDLIYIFAPDKWTFWIRTSSWNKKSDKKSSTHTDTIQNCVDTVTVLETNEWSRNLICFFSNLDNPFEKLKSTKETIQNYQKR